MTRRPPAVPPQLAAAALRTFAANERMNQILIEQLDPAIWKAKPLANVRTIAAIPQLSESELRPSHIHIRVT